MGNFQQNVRRISESEHNLGALKTKKKCGYIDHSGDAHAVLFVEVPVEECCRDEDNRMVPLCWRDTLTVYHREEFACACGGDNNVHKIGTLSYKGDIQPVDA